MTETPPKRSLQISEDLRFQEKEWRIQHIVWVFLYLLLVAIMLGLFGKGVLSSATAGAPDDPVTLEYQRFMRYGSPDDLRFTIQSSSDQVQLMLDRDYFDHVELSEVVPQPDRMLATSDAITFFFPAHPGESMRVTLSIKPEKIGKRDSWFGLQGHPRQAFSQFVYP